MIRVFIGYDSKETVAYHVLANSIMRHASVPVSITPLVLRQLPMHRERTPTQSTEFSFSRFIVPWLCGFKGSAIFMDCDMLCRADIADLVGERGKAVSVVKHDYQPRPEDKFLGQRQSIYEKKNWSSVMVFDNASCVALTPQYVNKASGLELHQFKWLGEYQIGSLDASWNHLVGEYEPNPDAKLAHFTRGTPCFPGYENCEFADEWRAERDLMLWPDGGRCNRMEICEDTFDSMAQVQPILDELVGYKSPTPAMAAVAVANLVNDLRKVPA